MDPVSHNESNSFYVKAVLECGAEIEIIQRARGMILEAEITPMLGISIGDTATIKDNKLQIRMTVESMAGVYQLLHMILNQSKKRKKFLGIF